MFLMVESDVFFIILRYHKKLRFFFFSAKSFQMSLCILGKRYGKCGTASKQRNDCT